MSGLVLGGARWSLGCPPGECGRTYSLEYTPGNFYIKVHSCTGSFLSRNFQEALLHAVRSSAYNFVKELLVAGTRDYNNEAYNLAKELGNAEIAELINKSETMHNLVIEHPNGYPGVTCLRGLLNRAIDYNDFHDAKEGLSFFSEEKLSPEEVSNFVERAHQLGSEEFETLIKKAPIIGPAGLSFEEYLQMKDKQTITPVQDSSNN